MSKVKGLPWTPGDVFLLLSFLLYFSLICYFRENVKVEYNGLNSLKVPMADAFSLTNSCKHQARIWQSTSHLETWMILG